MDVDAGGPPAPRGVAGQARGAGEAGGDPAARAGPDLPGPPGRKRWHTAGRPSRSHNASIRPRHNRAGSASTSSGPRSRTAVGVRGAGSAASQRSLGRARMSPSTVSGWTTTPTCCCRFRRHGGAGGCGGLPRAARGAPLARGSQGRARARLRAPSRYAGAERHSARALAAEARAQDDERLAAQHETEARDRELIALAGEQRVDAAEHRARVEAFSRRRRRPLAVGASGADPAAQRTRRPAGPSAVAYAPGPAARRTEVQA